ESVDLVESHGLCGKLDLGPRKSRREAESDNEDARALEDVAARDFVLQHIRFPQPIACAARLTARRMRKCVPQRQRFLASACLISPSLGRLVFASSAAACMIMPLMQ